MVVNKVMVAGHICLDITPGFPKSTTGGFNEVFAPGKLINVDSAVIGTGGAVSNTGLAMSRLGLDIKLNGKVGDDTYGRLIKELLGKKRASSFKTVTGQSSSYTIVLALPGIDRIFLHHPGTNDTFKAEDIDDDALDKCLMFHFGYPTLMKRMYENGGQELYQIFKKAKHKGVVTSLDMTLPDPKSASGQADWETILKRVLPLVDIFCPSIEEIAYMLDRPLFEKRKANTAGLDPVFDYTAGDCSKLASEILEMGVKIIAIKMGVRGYYLRTSDSYAIKKILPSSVTSNQWPYRELWAPSYKAEFFGSATGAGDATIAGFLTAFMNGLGPIEAAKTANVLGWQNVRVMDTLSGIEDWPTTLNMVHDDFKPRNDLDIVGHDWHFLNSEQVYLGPNDKFIK
jgi:sugar/nucleoside kinase (ribokinase family)